jgi:hypothetical protein
MAGYLLPATLAEAFMARHDIVPPRILPLLTADALDG